MIKFLAMDVDGTLTDGKVYMGNDGESFKAFDIKDGCGIKEILPMYGIIPIIITARNSKMLSNRCEELGITEIHQGVRKKLDCLKEIVEKYSNVDEHYTLQDVAYVGDDILDLQCMEPIKQAGGLAACPKDAAEKVISCCDYIAPHKGGEGAVRDVIEYIIASHENEKDFINDKLDSRLEKAIEYISALNFSELTIGKHEVEDGFFYTVQEYEAFDENESVYESHKQYIDIQWLVTGYEKLFVTDIKNLKVSAPYDVDRDVIHYESSNNMSGMLLSRGSCAVLFPNDAHRAGRVNGQRCMIKKVVGKLKIDVFRDSIDSLNPLTKASSGR